MNSSETQEDTLFTHENGLSFSYGNSSIRSTKTAQGFILDLAPQGARQQNQIIVEYRAEKPASVEELKELGGEKIFYHRESVEGGSGGEEVVLTLWKLINTDKWVYVEHTRQADTATDVAPTWVLIEKAH
ncbi:MAG TPA: Tsi3 family protein [Cellvibrionaceae bacterium]